MRRSEGEYGVAPIECISARRNKWRIRWDIQPKEGSEDLVTFMEEDFNHKPSLDEIKKTIEFQIDEQTKARIVDDFIWNGKNIKLNDTTQRNFLFAVFEIEKTGYVDRSPFMGLLESETDVEAADELGDITLAMWQHIKARRAEGIVLKRAVDYTQYEL